MLGAFANQKLGTYMYHVLSQLMKWFLIKMVPIYFVDQLLADKNVTLSCYRDVSIVEKGLCRVLKCIFGRKVNVC